MSRYHTTWNFLSPGTSLFKAALITALRPPSNLLHQPYWLAPLYWELVTSRTLPFINSFWDRWLSFWILVPWRRDPLGCPETSARYYHYSQCNNQEERCSHLLRGANLKWCRILGIIDNYLINVRRGGYYIMLSNVNDALYKSTTTDSLNANRRLASKPFWWVDNITCFIIYWPWINKGQIELISIPHTSSDITTGYYWNVPNFPSTRHIIMRFAYKLFQHLLNRI